MIAMVNHILHAPYKGYVLQTYIESKVIELLLAALHEASNVHPLGPVKLSPYDIELLHEAQRIAGKGF